MHPKSETMNCPVCKADIYLNPNLTLLVSPCFHKMCTSCINRLFTSANPCPICKVILRKNDFVSVVFEDVVVEREVDIRSKLFKIFNKFPSDFSNLLEYNNYLENVEEIVFNLLQKKNIQETQEFIQKYKQENKEIIAKNNKKIENESKSTIWKVEREKKEKILRKEQILKELKELKSSQNQLHLQLLDKLQQATDSEGLDKALEEYKTVNSSLLNQELMHVDIVDDYDFSQEDQEWIMELDVFTKLDVLNNYLDPWTAPLKTAEKSLYVKACGYTPRMTYERSISLAFDNVFLKTVAKDERNESFDF